MRPLATTLFCLISILVMAQDGPEAFLHSNPMRLNPAFAGAAGRGRITANHRIQWPKVDGGFNTFQMHYDNYIAKIKSGIGATYDYEHIANGTVQHHGLMLHYAFHAETKVGLVIRPALSLGFLRERLDNLVFTITPDNGIDDRFFSFNLGAGVVFTYKGLAFGYYANHINRAEKVYEMDALDGGKLIRHKSHIAYQHELTEDIQLALSILYHLQGEQQALQPVFTTSLYGVNIGVGYRYTVLNDMAYLEDDLVLFFVGYSHDRFSVAYAYEHWLNREQVKTFGSTHEVSLGFLFAQKEATSAISTYDKFYF